MKRRIKGIAPLLFSVLLAICVGAIGWRYFNLPFLGIPWPAAFLLAGAAGLAPPFWPEKE